MKSANNEALHCEILFSILLLLPTGPWSEVQNGTLAPYWHFRGLHFRVQCLTKRTTTTTKLIFARVPIVCYKTICVAACFK